MITHFITFLVLLQSIHKLGKQENNFFTSIHKLYSVAGKPVPENTPYALNPESGDLQNNAEKGSTGSQGNSFSYFTK